MSTNIAYVDHPVTKHCPILTTGDVSPKALVDLVDAHKEYFIAKDIADTDKVKKILGGFKDIHIRDWISSDCDRLLLLSYKDFMDELRSNYLPADWEDNVHTQILTIKMDKNVKFWDWCQEIRALNIILHGMDSHFLEATLHNQLEAALKPSLRLYCVHEKLGKITVLKDWVTAVKEADEKLKDDRKCSREIFREESALHAAKCPTLANHSHFGNSESKSSSSSSPTTSSNIKCCPKLDDLERKLLVLFNGCFKCHRFNQSHGTLDCPNDFPDGKTYKKITVTCDAAGNAPKKDRKSHPSTKGKAVAAVTNDEMSTLSEDDDDFISTIMPSAILRNGSFSEGDVSPPLCCKHFVTKFKIAANHLDFPLTFASLIDNGAHLILIRPEVADELCLEHHLLKEPETISVAIEDGKKKKKVTLYHYVKFAVTSLDNVWTSKTIHAIIALGLCMPVILGLPFLIHNDIITDHMERSCIDKKMGYNFLNPARVFPPPPPRKRATDQIRITKSTKKAVLTELKEVCRQ